MKTHNYILFALSVIIIFGCSEKEKTRWFKGNTHAHTVICGHADSTPKFVTNWYHENGYNFLILSEHNHFIDPDTVKMPQEARKDFLLIPGEEVTGPRIVHSTAMNIKELVIQDFDLDTDSEILQDHVNRTIEKGGHTILNHPNYKYAVSTEEILPVNNLYLFELFNGHPDVNNHGDHEHISTEAMWDELLTNGMIVYGVSSDDAHHFQTIDSAYSNPGRGWVMVNAAELTSSSITDAMINGDFYSSSGVFLEECSTENNIYKIVVDKKETQKQLLSSNLYGKRVESGNEGFTIEFIGPKGKKLSSESSYTSRYEITKENEYIRAKVTYTRKHYAGGMEEFYAWGQPVFTDRRLSDK